LTERQRLDILGCEVDCVDTAMALDRITEFVHERRVAHVVTFGAEMAMYAQRDARYRETINAADLVVADTIGIVWASRALGKPLRERVAGIELIDQLFEIADYPVYLLGGAEGVAAAAAASLQARHPRLNIGGTQHGYFPDAQAPHILNSIQASGARVVLVALGFPRQEFWIREHMPQVGPAVCIGVGGAFDVWSGRVQRAPLGWRRAGLEWLYRLVREPSRLGRQLALPFFALRVLAQARRQ
jgi:N-acetylglucosaminyldiphosphoundecaprenol N-acetyl-beta-D-mannosaminyltransferase